MSAAVFQIIAAIIGAVATITGALIASRRRDPVEARTPVPAGAPLSKSVWIGGISLLLWIIPILAYLTLPFGFYIAVRDTGIRRGWAPGLTLCAIALVLAILNSALGAYQGAHGTGWWQQ